MREPSRYAADVESIEGRAEAERMGEGPKRASSGKPRIGLALGSGSARGWAHIGVLRALGEAGIEPDVVCGTSIGAIVGALYASGRLDAFEGWVRKLTRRDVLAYLDVSLAGGGFIEGKRLADVFRAHFGDITIEQLPVPFVAVATDLMSGREVWLRKGSLLQALRASMSLPGIFTPVKQNGTWLVDGGLVNPVPISVCRALGADLVIAVNLNGDLVGRHLQKYRSERSEQVSKAAAQALEAEEKDWLDRLSSQFRERVGFLRNQMMPADGAPGMFDVIAGSLNIMQDRITRSRMAGDPPDFTVNPRLAHLGLLEFDRAEEAIAEGQAAMRQILPALRDIV